MRFSDQTHALNFLRNAKSSGANMQVFRCVLRANADETALHLYDDQQVLEKLSRLLLSGRIKVRARGDHSDAQPSQSTGSSGGAVPQAAPARREPRPMPAPKPKPERAPKPVPVIDIEQQIAALKAAAASGAPFCEQCERARLKREAAA